MSNLHHEFGPGDLARGVAGVGAGVLGIGGTIYAGNRMGRAHETRRRLARLERMGDRIAPRYGAPPAPVQQFSVPVVRVTVLRAPR